MPAPNAFGSVQVLPWSWERRPLLARMAPSLSATMLLMPLRRCSITPAGMGLRNAGRCAFDASGANSGESNRSRRFIRISSPQVCNFVFERTVDKLAHHRDCAAVRLIHRDSGVALRVGYGSLM